MKIAQISHTYLPHVGGIEYYVHRLISHINGRYDIYILTSDMGRKKDDNMHKTIYFKSFPVLMRNPFLFGLIKHLWNNKYDIMHLHQIWFLPSLEAAILKKDSKIITTIHGVWPATSNYLTMIFLYLYKPFAQFVLNRSDIIVVLSKKEEDKLKKIFSVDTKKVHIITNGIYPESADWSKVKEVINKYKLHGKKIVFFTGRIIPDKNPEILLESIPEVMTKVDNVIYIITGPIDQNYRLHLEEIIEKYRAKNFCIITGEVDRNELIALYKIASVFVSIGSWEGLPTRLLEAMYQECASIIYDYGSIADIITNDQDGIIIQKLDSRILANNIVILLQDDELNKKIGLNARQTVLDKYIWDKSAEKIESLYRDITIKND